MSHCRLISLFLGWIFLAFSIVGVGGCGPSVGQVSGKVTLKGNPVAGTEIEFASEQNAQETYHGLSADGGVFHVSYRTQSGLPVGRYKVTIHHYTLPNGKPLPPGEAGAALKSKDLARKNSYLFSQEIVSGGNAVDFELTKGKK